MYVVSLFRFLFHLSICLSVRLCFFHPLSFLSSLFLFFFPPFSFFVFEPFHVPDAHLGRLKLLSTSRFYLAGFYSTARDQVAVSFAVATAAAVIFAACTWKDWLAARFCAAATLYPPTTSPSPIKIAPRFSRQTIIYTVFLPRRGFNEGSTVFCVHRAQERKKAWLWINPRSFKHRRPIPLSLSFSLFSSFLFPPFPWFIDREERDEIILVLYRLIIVWRGEFQVECWSLWRQMCKLFKTHCDRLQLESYVSIYSYLEYNILEYNI